MTPPPEPRWLEPNEIFIGKVINAEYKTTERGAEIVVFTLRGYGIGEREDVADLARVLFVLKHAVANERNRVVVFALLEVFVLAGIPRTEVPEMSIEDGLNATMHLDFEIECTERVTKNGNAFRLHAWKRFYPTDATRLF